jgi:peroxiredoxin
MPPSAESTLLGEPVPKFSRPTLAGTTVDTESLRGRVVVVKFFAEWCEPCKETLPEAERLQRKYDDITIIGVSIDDYAATARKLVDEYELSFPVVHDPKVLRGRFRIRDIPATFVVDASGTVRWFGGPDQDTKDLAAAIAATRD